MSLELEKELTEMTKDEALAVVKKTFKGQKRFIQYCEAAIASTPGFIGIIGLDFDKDNWNWEVLCRLRFDSKDGWKHVVYRKGNKKYAPDTLKNPDLKGNTTSEINEFIFTSYHKASQETESYAIQG